MSRMRRSLAHVAGRCLDAAAIYLFPACCFACGRALGRRQRLGACAACWAALVPITQPSCRRCALPLPAALADDGWPHGSCARCAVRPLPLDEAVAAVIYDAPARRFLLRAKSRFRSEILGPIGAQLAAVVALRRLPERCDIIVPVPSSWRARLRRGFDPAREIARRIASETGLPLARSVLRPRLLGGPAAKALNARARWTAAGRRFIASPDARGRRVLLVDDVLTTGATAAACARSLRNAGATEVRAAVWARTPSPRGRL